ncbi:MAG: hypothetical protein EBX40_05115, partial [Gammaproteobacteria bacterium]|nr:hypothetical protein [Gammaproteobacteria bacterium]
MKKGSLKEFLKKCMLRAFLSRLFQGNDFIVDWQSDLLYRPETAQKVLVLLLNLPCLTETLTPEAKLSILDRLFRVLTDPEQVLRPDFNWVGHFERFLSQAYSSRRLVSFVQPAGAENGSAEFKPDDSPAAQRVAQHKRDQHKRDHYDVSQNAQRWMQLIQAHQELAKLIEQMKVVLLTLNGTCELSKFKMVQGLKAFAVLVRMIAICRRAREEDIAPWPQSKHCAKLLAELDLTHLPSVLDAQVQLRSLVRLLPTEPFCKTAKLESEQPPSDPLKSRVVAGVRTLVNYPNGVEGFEQLKTSYSYLVNPTEDEVIQHVVVLAKNRLAAKTRRRQPATWAIYNLWSQLGDPANLTEQNVYKLERSIQTHCASSRHQIVPSASIMLTCASLWDEYLQGLDPRVKSLFLAVMGGQVGPLFNQLVKNPSEEAAASSSAATAPQVEVDVRDAYGRSLLRWAVEYPDVGISLAMVDLLLRLGATCADYGFGTTGQDCRDQAGYMPFNMSQNQGVTERLSAASNLKVVRDAEVDATFTSSRRSRDGHYRADQLMLDVIEYAEKDYANWNSIVDFYNASSVRSVESLRRLLAYATAYPEPEISVGDGDKEHLRALTEEILKRRLNAFLKSGSKLPALVRLAWANNKYLIQNVVGDSSEGPLNRIAAVFM